MFSSNVVAPSQVDHTFPVLATDLVQGANSLRLEVFGRNDLYLATGAASVEITYDPSADPCGMATAMTLGASVEGSISSDDCLDGEARFDFYTLSLLEPSTVAFRAVSGEFAPHIRVLGSEGEAVAFAYAEGDSAMFTRAVLPAGAHRLHYR